MDAVLRARGLPTHGRAAYRAFVGEGADRLAEHALGERQDLRADVVAAFKVRYDEGLIVESRPYPGIVEMLDRLDLPCAVLTNKPDAHAVRLVESLFPGRFAVVRGQRAGVPRKPDPTAALAIADSLGVSPAEVSLVGDSGVDMRTAVAAGLGPIGVLWGYRSADELTAAGAEHLAATAHELLGLLTQVP